VAYESKPNSGLIFKNDKQGNATWADYQGKVNVDGRDYFISLWIKEGQKGKFFSAGFKPVGAKKIDPQAPISTRRVDLVDDGEVPF
jgi:hypothetical protein